MFSQLNQQLRMLHEISLIALTSESLETIAQQIVEKICSATEFPIGAIELYDRSRQVMIFIGVQGLPPPTDGDLLEVPVEQTLSGKVAATGQPVVKRYAPDEIKTCQANPTLNQVCIGTFICQPMTVNEQVMGVLSLAHPASIETDELFLEWISLLANFVASLVERRRAETRLRHDALHDGLTGLPNRLLLLDRLEQVMARAKRQDDYHFALLFIDLDRFKVINDSLGHVVGDRLLVAIASKLQDCVRTDDTVARLGGDEFIILLDNIKTEQVAIKIAQRINQELKTPVDIEGQKVFTTASIGIAFNSSFDRSPVELLRNADLAMYEAKAQGKSCHAIFQPMMHHRAHTLLELETNLRGALERREFLLHYQPIVSLANGDLVGFEALVRWLHPQKGLIPPSAFIPVAEETGLIVPIGRWILFESCHQLAIWQRYHPQAASWKMNVNLSGRQLKQGDLIDQIDFILDKTGIEGKNLKLEITESTLMKNTEFINYIFNQLIEREIQISIDDFGTGYSSLSYLHYLPVNTLKIDRSFINRMTLDEENLKIVEAIITLAHHLQIDVTAEGVETKEQLDKLRLLGCEFGQGYLFSRPLEAQAVGTLFGGTEVELKTYQR
jgi:diguanylate cyclase (GGDEF)-like protein